MEIESSWTVFRIILLAQVHLERSGNPVSVEDEMDLFAEGSNEALRAHAPLLQETKTRRFRLEAKVLQATKSSNRASFKQMRSSARLRTASNEGASPQSSPELEQTPPTSKLSRKDSFLRLSFVRVVIVGDENARRIVASTLLPESKPNMLQEWKVFFLCLSVCLFLTGFVLAWRVESFSD
jgi:hypothetical protein